MRILVALIAVVVFGAMLILDTAALVRLAVFCVTGGCGVSPTWIAIGGTAVALVAGVSLTRPRAEAKIARVPKNAPRRPSRGKAAAPRKAKRAK
jgi:hypothetical protein